MAKEITKIFLIFFIVFGFFYFFVKPNLFLSLFLKPRSCFKENLQLKQENAFLKTRIVRLEQEEKTFQNLEKIYQTTKKDKEKLVLADIVGNAPFNYQQFVIINLGSEDGIKKNMPVILPILSSQNKQDSLILFGIVSEVDKQRSKVITIFDKDFRTSAYTLNSNKKKVIGVVKGETNKVIFDLIPKKENIKIGDLVFTTGFDNKFPANFYIGKVSLVSDKQGVFKKISLSLPYKWYEITKVLVVLNY